MNRRFEPSGPLRGHLRVAGDKSVSHRAAIVGAMASEPVRVRGFLDAVDTNSTLAAVRELGAMVEVREGELLIRGCGLREAQQPAGAIDVGNAGTLMRLLPGWLAFQSGASFTLDGDESIRRRPVDRIAEPLRLMGASIDAREGRFPPFTVHGCRSPESTTSCRLPARRSSPASCSPGSVTEATTVVEPVPTRDHTERLLLSAGAAVRRVGDAAGGYRTTVGNADELELELIEVPGDLSSAAFLIAAGVLVSGSRLVLEGVGVNWTRAGLLRILERMGAIVLGELEPVGSFAAGEPIADLEISSAPIEGTTVEAHEVPLAIDELPLVALLGCFAEGETIVRRSRRAASQGVATASPPSSRGCADSAPTSRPAPDGFVVRGTGGLRGGRIEAHGDHRLALLGAVAGLASREGVEVVGMEAAAVSYPGFVDDARASLAGP